MVETILPDVYIEVRAEGLIVPGQITVGRLGVVGTASKGDINVPKLLGSYSDARQVYGDYDAWENNPAQNELTLVRALQLAYLNGADSVYAVRVSATTGGVATAKAAGRTLSATGDCVELRAKSEGEWGNKLTVKVEPAAQGPFVVGEKVTGTPPKLRYQPVESSRNRITRFNSATGQTTRPEIVYTGVGSPGAGKVRIEPATGVLTFGDPLAPTDEIRATYVVDKAKAVQVTVRDNAARVEEPYVVASGTMLVDQVNSRTAGSALVTATGKDKVAELPKVADVAPFTGGTNGETANSADYIAGLDPLLTVDANIIVAAGQTASDLGAALSAHCDNASTDLIKRDRIAVVGADRGGDPDTVLGQTIDNPSGRLVLVAPGIRTKDSFAQPPDVTLPASYTAAAVAGLLAGLPAQTSPTNKPLKVDGLEKSFGPAVLAQLVSGRVFVLEDRPSPRVVKGITTSTNTAWTQITTRRIVDFAKAGVRSAASPYIGLLNNERVRGAMRATINSFLADMVLAEQLVSYTLDVTATRAEEIRGIARVTMTLRPVFSIDYIKVTIFLE